MRTDKPPPNLHDVLRYDPKTGKFFWLESRGRVAEGDEAGTPDKDGYIQIRIDGVIYKAHRLAWYFMNKDGGHTLRVGKDSRVASHKDGAKIRMGSDWVVVKKGQIIFSRPPILGKDPIPNDDK